MLAEHYVFKKSTRHVTLQQVLLFLVIFSGVFSGSRPEDVNQTPPRVATRRDYTLGFVTLSYDQRFLQILSGKKEIRNTFAAVAAERRQPEATECFGVMRNSPRNTVLTS